MGLTSVWSSLVLATQANFKQVLGQGLVQLILSSHPSWLVALSGTKSKQSHQKQVFI